MKQAYISPAVKVEDAVLTDGMLTVTSIPVSDESGNEEYVKEQNAAEGDWSIDW